MNGEELVDLLGVDWTGAELRLASYVDDGRASVDRYRWCPDSAEWEDPGLMWVERDGREPVARARDVEPPNLSHWVAYGFDRDGRLLLSTRVDSEGILVEGTVWAPAGAPRQAQLLFHRHMGALQLTRAIVPETSDGRLAALRRVFEAGRREIVERYEYDACGRLARILIDEVGGGDSAEHNLYELERDADGEVVLMRQHTAAGSDVVYRRRDPASLRAARRRVEDELVARTRQWAQRLAPPEPVYCLAMVYGFTDPRLPPALAMGTVRERQVVAADTSADIYAPAEFEIFDAEPWEFTDAALREDCRALSQEWRSREEDAEPRGTLVRAAARLSSEDWTKLLAPASDYIIYAVDDELCDLSRNLKAAGVGRTSA